MSTDELKAVCIDLCTNSKSVVYSLSEGVK